MSLPLPMQTMIGHAIDRFMVLISPPRGEVSPLADGATVAEWAAAGGLGRPPHSLLEPLGALDMGNHDPATVAHAALQALSHRAKVERVGGLPLRYRPLVRDAR